MQLLFENKIITEMTCDIKKLSICIRIALFNFQESGHKTRTGHSVLGLVAFLVSLERLEDSQKVTREFGESFCYRSVGLFHHHFR